MRPGPSSGSTRPPKWEGEAPAEPPGPSRKLGGSLALPEPDLGRSLRPRGSPKSFGELSCPVGNVAVPSIHPAFWPVLVMEARAMASEARDVGREPATPRRSGGRVEYVVLAPLRWLEQSRGWRRRGLIVLYLLVVVVLGGAVRWATSLNGLPDIGDPFDVAAFRRSLDVPPDEDAFTLYRQAARRLHEDAPRLDPQRFRGDAIAGWSNAGPTARDQVQASREALDLWRRASERERAQAVPGGRFRMDLGRVERIVPAHDGPVHPDDARHPGGHPARSERRPGRGLGLVPRGVAGEPARGDGWHVEPSVHRPGARVHHRHAHCSMGGRPRASMPPCCDGRWPT